MAIPVNNDYQYLTWSDYYTNQNIHIYLITRYSFLGRLTFFR